ncbi:preprotein translocase subunit YajC [Aeromicrobium sp.]|uniref:preprotein translocase subunit YajC n=1 Tax=Aeromicrobium sp. TaxID=1871063 RepID=UPI003C383711
MDNLGALLPLILLVVAFFFLVVRPARARQRAFLQTQSELAPGTRVMIASGIFGDIVSLAEDTIELRVAAGTVVTVNRQAVARVIPPAPAETETSIED